MIKHTLFQSVLGLRVFGACQCHFVFINSEVPSFHSLLCHGWLCCVLRAEILRLAQGLANFFSTSIMSIIQTRNTKNVPLIRVKSWLRTNLTITVFNWRLQNRFRNLDILHLFFNSWHWNKIWSISTSVSGGTEECTCIVKFTRFKETEKRKWRLLGGRWLIVLTDTAQVVWSVVDTTSMVSLTNMAKLSKS